MSVAFPILRVARSALNTWTQLCPQIVKTSPITAAGSLEVNLTDRRDVQTSHSNRSVIVVSFGSLFFSTPLINHHYGLQANGQPSSCPHHHFRRLEWNHHVVPPCASQWKALAQTPASNETRWIGRSGQILARALPLEFRTAIGDPQFQFPVAGNHVNPHRAIGG